MKQRTIIFLLLAMPLFVFAQTKKVAILETIDKSGEVPYAHKLMVRTSLAKAVTETVGLEAYDRTDMDAIMGEQDFQRTGLVSNDQIRRLGEMTGAQYILVVELVSADNRNYFLTAKILDVESARTEITDYILMDKSTQGIASGCKTLADKMFGNMKSKNNSFNSQEKEKEKEAETKKKEPNKEVEKNSKQKDEEKTARAIAKEESAKQKEQIKEEKKSAKKEVTMPVVNPEFMLERKECIEGWRFVYEGNEMDKRQYQKFLKNTCPDAYMKYREGKRTAGAGWFFFWTGLIIDAGAIPAFAILSEHHWSEYIKYEYYYDPVYAKYANDCRERSDLYDTLMWTSIGVGCGSLLTSLITLPVGYAKMNKKSVDIFNTRCNSKTTTLNFGVTSSNSGIGLAVQF